MNSQTALVALGLSIFSILVQVWNAYLTQKSRGDLAAFQDRLDQRYVEQSVCVEKMRPLDRLIAAKRIC